MDARFDFALGTVIGACLFALASCGSHASHANPKPGAQPPNGWRSYGDAKLGFSIDYPEGWTVDARYVYPMRIEGRELRGVAFTIPERLRANTNLSPDTRISVESAASGACDPRAFLDSPQDELNENDGAHVWSVATGGDAGAGNFYDETVYVLAGSSPCHAIRYFIHSTNIGNYDPGTVRQFDRTALVTVFDKIRGTLAVSPASGREQN